MLRKFLASLSLAILPSLAFADCVSSLTPMVTSNAAAKICNMQSPSFSGDATFEDGMILPTGNDSIRSATSDGADNQAINIGGGGAMGGERGAQLTLRGNEASAGGSIQLYTGDAGGSGDIYYRASDDHLFQTYSGTSLWSILQEGDLVGQQAINNIITSTSDGADNAYLALSGGGGIGSARGPNLFLYGNEVASIGGNLQLRAGVGGDIITQHGDASSETQFRNNAFQTMLKINNSGNLVMDATNGGYFVGTYADAVTATGSAIGDALQLTKCNNYITGGALNTGVILPTNFPVGAMCVFSNFSGSDKKVYPNGSNQIEGLGAAGPFTLASSTDAIFYKASSNRYRVVN